MYHKKPVTGGYRVKESTVETYLRKQVKEKLGAEVRKPWTARGAGPAYPPAKRQGGFRGNQSTGQRPADATKIRLRANRRAGV